jgi:filamentous hemagglutinin family protein
VINVSNSLNFILVGTILNCNFQTSPLLAQIIPDNTLGAESSQVQLNTILGGATRGENLFHSFEQFSIPTGENISFTSPTGIKRIVARVTGNQASLINGVLGIVGGGDLFLINPNGITFGREASLDIQGSFLASTAETILFPEGQNFSAKVTNTAPLLSVSAPLGLAFGAKANPISNQANANFSGLLLPANKTISLVGGDIEIAGGNITAFFGNSRVELVSVGENSQVDIQSLSNGWQIQTEGVTNFRDITLKGANKSTSFILALTPPAIGIPRRGEVHLHGKNITIADGSQVQADGGIFVKVSEVLKITGFQQMGENLVRSGLYAPAISSTDGGGIHINARNLILQERGQIFSGVTPIEIEGQFISSTGKGGNIFLNIAEEINISGADTAITSGTASLGNGGNIFLQAPRINILDEASINSAAQEGAGNAGNINLNTDFLYLDNQGVISAESLGGSGGNLNLTVGQLLILRHQSRISTTAGTESFGGGDGGNINITALAILAIPQENSDITANAYAGDGGNINLITLGLFGIAPRAATTELSDITASSQLSNSGTITISNPDKRLGEQINILPQEFLEVAKLIDKTLCAAGGANELTITGRSGLPPAPGQMFTGANPWEDWRTDSARELDNQVSATPTLRQQKILVEFQGWTINRKGNVVLTAQPPIVTPQGEWLPPLDCQHLRSDLPRN